MVRRPFSNSVRRKSSPALPSEANPLLINMQGMLTQGAVDAYTDNPDALLSHGKNFQFVDFIDPNNTGKDTRRLYFPWDLDAVFHSTTGNIYASGSGRKLAPSPYQEVILGNPVFRAQYNQIMTDLLNGPLSVAKRSEFS